MLLCAGLVVFLEKHLAKPSGRFVAVSALERPGMTKFFELLDSRGFNREIQKIVCDGQSNTEGENRQRNYKETYHLITASWTQLVK
jgi:hypothetical protein